MSIENNNNINNQFEIPLKLSKPLEESGIIYKFVIDPKDKFVKLRLNSVVNPPVAVDASTEVIKKPDGWKKFTSGFSNDLKLQKLDSKYHTWIISTINENGDLIRSIARSTSSSNNNNTPIRSEQQEQQQKEQEQNKNNQFSDTSDIPDITENTITNQKEKIIIEKISVSQAIRRNSGIYAVTGTIIGVSILSKTISKISTYCEKCGITDEVIFNPIPISNIKSIKENCKSCGRHIQFYNIKPLDHKNTVTIELQDTNSFDDLDRLSVFLFDQDTIGIMIGENVEIVGEIRIIEKGFIYLPYLYGQSIQYLNRENFILTKSDFDKIREFKETNGGEDGVINALVSIFDLSIVECEFEKKAVLMCAVNTSTKIGDESEQLDELFIGPPGLAKSKMLKRATEIVPGSSRVGGQYSTGKSLTAIVEKTDSNTILRLGSIPRSRDAICAINELAKLGDEDLDKLYDVMEERGFPFEKYGIKKFIPTPTAIIASANPANKDTWINSEKIDFNELPFLAPLKDRFDLILIFQQKKDPKERDDFVDQLAEVESKKEKGELVDHTEFLIKYIQYAKQFNPILTDEAWFMLKEFYKKVNAKGFGSPRVLKTLKKLAKAVARLKLKNVVDEKDAQETMEYYNAMLVKFQKHVVVSESIKMIAYKKGVDIIKNFKNISGITLEALFENMCKDDKQLATYFGYDIGKSLKIQDNRKVSEVKKLLLNNSHIKRVQDNPIVLKWFDNNSNSSNNNNSPSQSDTSDIPDKENYPDQEKIDKKNNEIFNENGSKVMSDVSGMSDSESIKGVQLTPGGRVYRVTDEWYDELNNGDIK
jgi:DNA replicative helicase MCM subunit Mcm2 (Cdc46/Mcm family)